MIINYKDKKPNINKEAFVASSADIIGNVTLEKDSSVWYGAVLRADVAEIIIGEGSNIQDGSVCHVDFNTPVIVGKNVTVGHNVTLHGCKIEDCSLIGMGATILDNVVVGKNSLIGAGAIVTSGTVIPENSLVLGAPAKIKRSLSTEEINKIRENSSLYVKLSKEHMEEIWKK